MASRKPAAKKAAARKAAPKTAPKPARKPSGASRGAPAHKGKTAGDKRKTEWKKAEREAVLRDMIERQKLGIDLDKIDGPGRPTEYDPRLCRVLIDWTRETGKSLTAFAGAIGTHRQRLNEWAHKHPEFQDAIATAKATRALVLETQAMLDDKAGPINYRVLALKNCAPDDFREVTDVRHGGLPGAPPIASAMIDVSKMTAQQVYDYVVNGAPLPPTANPAADGDEG